MTPKDHFVLYKRGNGIYYYYIYSDGKRKYFTTAERKKNRALALVLERIRSDSLNYSAASDKVTFREYTQDFFVWDRCPIIREELARGCKVGKANTRTKRQRLEKYLWPAFGDMQLSSIRAKDIRDFLLDLPQKAGIKPQTANAVLIPLRQALERAKEDCLIKSNPCDTIKPLGKVETLRGAFTPEEVKEILSGTWKHQDAQLMCRVAAMTGMRFGEVAALQRSDIHEDYIEVRSSFSRQDGLKSTKSSYKRIVPLPASLRRLLKAQDTFGPWLFSGNGNKPYDTKYVNTHLRERMDAINGKAPSMSTGTTGYKIDYIGRNLSFHSFRHFFNTRLVASGVQGEKVRAVIGHESEKMTEHYLHLNADDLRQIALVSEQIVL